MKRTYTKYSQLRPFVPFYSGEYEELQALVNAKTPLSTLDIQQLIEFLSNDNDKLKQYFVTDFLALYKATIPNDLFEPVFKAGIRHSDPSFNRFFFLIAKKIKTEEAFFEALLHLLKNGTNYEKVMTVNSLYQNFKFYWAYVGESDSYFNREIKPNIEANQPKINRLMKVLICEFLSNKNLIVRYSISSYLPRALSRFPKHHKSDGRQILKIIKDAKLPKQRRATTPEFIHIWKQAIENKALGELFFNELKWRKRADNFDDELEEYETRLIEENKRTQQ